MRMCIIEEFNGGFKGVKCAANKILLFDVLTKDWAAEQLVGFRGMGFSNVLNTRLDADPESDEFKTACKAV